MNLLVGQPIPKFSAIEECELARLITQLVAKQISDMKIFLTLASAFLAGSNAAAFSQEHDQSGVNGKHPFAHFALRSDHRQCEEILTPGAICACGLVMGLIPYNFDPITFE
jgi:hypothetical protein